MRKYDLDERNVYNMDEKGFSFRREMSPGKYSQRGPGLSKMVVWDVSHYGLAYPLLEQHRRPPLYTMEDPRCNRAVRTP